MIRDAMVGKAMVALGRVVLAKRERVIMLQPWGKGLMGTTLRYAYEVREAASYFDDLPDVSVPQDMLQLAEHILESKAGDFEPATFADRYEEAVVAIGQTPSPLADAEATHPAPVIMYRVVKAALIPHDSAAEKASYVKHTNSWRLVLVEENSGERVERIGRKVADLPELSGPVFRRQPARLDLDRPSSPIDGIGASLGLLRHSPTEGAAEQGLRQIAGRRVGAAGDAAAPEFARNGGV